MQNSLLNSVRQSGLFVRTTASVLILTVASMVLQPTIAAAQTVSQQTAATPAQAPTEEDEFSDTLQEIEERIKTFQERLVAGAREGEERKELQRLEKKLRKLDKKVQEHFADSEQELAKKKLPPEILQRHRDMVASYRQELATMLANLQAMMNATTEQDLKSATDKTAKHLEGHSSKRPQQHFDPARLPNRNLEGDKQNKPRKKKEEFTRSGLFDTPHAKYAALGTYRYDTLAGANDPAYLAQTVEVQITQAVQDQAAALNHDPVAIYHWVRNNIDWLPTWGAMQDADHTLSSRRGNAMDIASLTIALLRASGIPARYVHGTLEIPADKFRNWAGGFTSIEAALGYASSGGIPTAGVVTGGRIDRVQMEHIWVEAAIDYQPSRGAVNREADTWVEMDPSYKQYDYLQGLDVQSIAGIDATALAQSFSQSGAVNDAEGWVQGLDATLLQNAQTQARTALEAHIAQMPAPTVGDIIGGRKSIIRDLPVLPSALMNKVLVKGVRYGELPDPLRHKVTFALGYDPYNGTPQKSYPFAQLNNKKVTLSFSPATPADEQALLSLLPPGPITDPAQLPQSLPSYLINVVPELRVEGQLVLTGSPMRLGENFQLNYSTDVVSHGTQHYSSIIPAGGYYAVAVAGGSMAPQRLTELQAQLQRTQTLLQTQDQALLAGLTRDDLLGDMFHAGMLGYFAEFTAMGHIMALQQKAEISLAPSMGVYGYKPKVNSFFGFPRSISAGGIEMDLPGVKSFNAMHDGDRAKLIDFRFQKGMLSSALEHAIPEQMFVTPTNPGEAVSAVKALAKASQAGQRIYHLTQATMTAALPNIHHDAGTMAEITAALNAGKTVITHTDAIAVPGWSGAGYIIFDPNTGDGAYKIAGGANGGEQKLEGGLEHVIGWVSAALYDVSVVVAEYISKSLKVLERVVVEMLIEVVDKFAKRIDIANVFRGYIESCSNIDAMILGLMLNGMLSWVFFMLGKVAGGGPLGGAIMLAVGQVAILEWVNSSVQKVCVLRVRRGVFV